MIWRILVLQLISLVYVTECAKFVTTMFGFPRNALNVANNPRSTPIFFCEVMVRGQVYTGTTRGYFCEYEMMGRAYRSKYYRVLTVSGPVRQVYGVTPPDEAISCNQEKNCHVALPARGCQNNVAGKVINENQYLIQVQAPYVIMCRSKLFLIED